MSAGAGPLILHPVSILYFLNITLHLLAALFWLGGMFFLALVGAPVLRRFEPPALRARLFQELGRAFRTSGWWAIAVLLVTGTANLYFRGLLRTEVLFSTAFWDSRYGFSLAWKLVGVAAMIIVSALHDFVLGPAAGRPDIHPEIAAVRRRRAAWLARLNAALGILVVAAAVRLARGG